MDGQRYIIQEIKQVTTGIKGRCLEQVCEHSTDIFGILNAILQQQTQNTFLPWRRTLFHPGSEHTRKDGRA